MRVSLAFSKFAVSLRRSFLDHTFQITSCPLLVSTITLGNGPVSSTPLQGSLTPTVLFKSKTIPIGVSSSPVSSSNGMMALSESLSNSVVSPGKKRSKSVDLDPMAMAMFGYSLDQLLSTRV